MSDPLLTLSMSRLVTRMKRFAETGVWDGYTESLYFIYARRMHDETRTSLVFTRDSGHHSSGWFKNPDYERCYHLSVGFWSFTLSRRPREYDHDLARVWVEAFFPRSTQYLWREGMVSKPDATMPEIFHYRVFCNPRWQPIIPRGEVYTRDFTEKGWESWSDIQDKLKEDK